MVVEVEGVKKGRHHTFGVVSPAGESLIRVSTTRQGDQRRWVAAIQAAGCQLRTLSPEARSRSPLRSADVRWVGCTPPAAENCQGKTVPGFYICVSCRL